MTELPVASAAAESEVEIFSRGLLKRMLLPAVLAVLAYGALLLYADVDAIVMHTGQVPGDILLWGTLLATGNYAVRFLRWQYYLRKLDLSVGFIDSALAFLAGFAMSITPGKVGEVIKSLLLKESHSIPVARSAPIVLAERVTDLAGLLILGALGLFAVPHGVPVAIVSLFFVGVLFALCTWKPLGNGAIEMVVRFERVAPLRGKLHSAYDSLTVLTGPIPFTVAVVNSVIAWGLQCISLNVFASAFAGVTLSLQEGLVAYSAPLLAGTLALVPGGLGITEASMTGALQTLGGDGMTPSVAAAITILSRLSSFWLAIALGFLALVVWRARRRQLDGNT